MLNATATPSFVETVARNHRKTLVRYAAVVWNRADAEDAVQDALVSAWEGLQEGDPRTPQKPENPVSLMMMITRYRAMSAGQRVQRRREAPMEDTTGPAFASPSGDPAELLDNAVEYAADLADAPLAELAAALATLTDRQRQAVMLRYAHGMKWADVADEMGLSEDSAIERAHLGLAKLRAYFGTDDHVETDAELIARCVSGEVTAGMQLMTDLQREAATLRYAEHLTWPEIAERLNVPVSTAKNRARRGLAKLRLYVADRAPQQATQRAA